MFVLIIDYGSGNIKSVYNSVKKTLKNLNMSIEVKVSNNLLEIKNSDKIILPGVGSFNQCMDRINKIEDLVGTLNEQIITKIKLCRIRDEIEEKLNNYSLIENNELAVSLSSGRYAAMKLTKLIGKEDTIQFFQDCIDTASKT